jgi:alpha-1,2-mannosyltransferase
LSTDSSLVTPKVDLAEPERSKAHRPGRQAGAVTPATVETVLASSYGLHATVRPVTANVYGLRLLRKPRVRLAVLVCVLAVVLVYRLGQFIFWTGQIQWAYDFSFYWVAAGHLLHGEPIYSAIQLAGPYAPQGQVGFLYPPPFAVAVIPFALVFGDPRLAEWGWTAIDAVIVVAAVLKLHGSEHLGERYPLLAGRGRWLLVGAAFAFPPVVAELVLGNVNILLLGLFTLAWLGIRRADTPAPDAPPGIAGSNAPAAGAVIAGIAIGVATVVKVFPGVLILWFLLTGRSRAAGWAIAAVVIVAAITLPVTGLQPWLDYPTVLANLSAPVDTKDTLAPTIWLMPYIGFTLARLLVAAIGLVIVVWTARTTSTRISFAIAVLVSILVAPALYQHYLAILVLPFALALGTGIRLRWTALAYFLMWGGQQGALGDLAWIVNKGLPTAGALLLLGLFMARASEPRTRSNQVSAAVA